MTDDRYVITGGPGAGKTTLLQALECDGYAVIPEVARAIIQQEVAANGDGLPWANRERYTDLMLKAAIRDYEKIAMRFAHRICFFDRSVLDAICYADMIGYTLSEATLSEVLSCRYHKKVFILPPWREIYETDGERKQSWEEAEYTYCKMKATYVRHGYEVIDVPKGSVGQRKDFVLSFLD